MSLRRIGRTVLEPLAGALFIALWIIAEYGRVSNVPVIVAFGVAIAISRRLPRLALIMVFVGLMLSAVGQLLVPDQDAYLGPMPAVHPITQTDWPLYAAALVVPALVAAGGSRRSLRPSLVAAILAALGLAALIAAAQSSLRWSHGRLIWWLGNWYVPTEVRVFTVFALLLLAIGGMLWLIGWLAAGLVRFIRSILRDPLIRVRVNDALKLGPDDAAVPKLTARERDVLLLISDGKSNAEIAAALFLGEATVKSHLRSILSKLGLKSRTEIAAYAWRTGLVQLV